MKVVLQESNGRSGEDKGEESLGILYSVCTALCGFNVEKGEEWKLMGLAPYGKLDREILAEFKSLLTLDGLLALLSRVSSDSIS